MAETPNERPADVEAHILREIEEGSTEVGRGLCLAHAPETAGHRLSGLSKETAVPGNVACVRKPS